MKKILTKQGDEIFKIIKSHLADSDERNDIQLSVLAEAYDTYLYYAERLNKERDKLKPIDATRYINIMAQQGNLIAKLGVKFGMNPEAAAAPPEKDELEQFLN